MRRLEAFATVAGAFLVLSAATALDWRLGALTLGVFLIASAIELPRRRA
jgi:hypothetical protein